jgi:hypothetical protein
VPWQMTSKHELPRTSIEFIATAQHCGVGRTPEPASLDGEFKNSSR